MRTLITKEHKHLLWKDELFGAPGSTNHTFLLLKYTEIYKYSENTLRLHIWNLKKLALIRSRGWILNELPSDELFRIVDVKTSNLPLLIALGAFKQRPHIQGKWIERKEELLGHKILPYNPTKLPMKDKWEAIKND